MSGGGGGTSTQVQKADPWAGAQPYITDYMSRAQGLANRPTQYYPGQTVAGFDPATQTAYSRMMAMADDPMGGANLASREVNRTLEGEYLPGGERFKSITDPAMDAINAQFASGGRYGSASHQQGLAKGMLEAVQPYYESERGRMMTASAMAPYADMATVSPYLQVGQARQGMNQSLIDADIARWNFGQDEPWQRLQRYASIVSPGAGFGSTASSTQPGGSSAAGALGGALGMGALSNAMPGLTAPFGFMGGWPLIAGGALLGGFL